VSPPIQSLGKNIAHTPRASDPAEIKRLNKAATRWLERNDKPSKTKQLIDRKRKERAARSTRVHRIR
jgi:hypothetical protein